MTPPAAVPPTARPPLPPARDRVAPVNIALLFALVLLAHLLRLLALSSSVVVDFASEIPLALLAYAAATFAACHFWRRYAPAESFRKRLAPLAALPARGFDAVVRFIRARPVAAVWLAAAAGVMASCYPVIFLGKSFVSPRSVEVLLYNRDPNVPGMQPGEPDFVTQRCDSGAMMWQHLPFSVVEHRAIFQDHELPVWNRYDGGGLTLIGQGLSMLGDPFNWAVVLTGGNPWAWDAKFLLARLLFAAGIGLGVRAATGRNAAALVLAFGVCFLQFFLFRFNHPAHFSLCYAPWILLPWLQLARDPRREESASASAPATSAPEPKNARTPWRWAWLLLLACWMQFNCGVMKESVIQLLGLNTAGALVLLLGRGASWRWKTRRLAQAAWMGVLFVLLATPFWRTFLEALAHSWNAYAIPHVWQLQPTALIGLFDDIFYRQFNAMETMLDPAANFLVLLGVAFALASFRTLVGRDRTFLALVLVAAGALLMVFGVAPPVWIRATPFLGGIWHIDNTFTCLLLVLLPVIAGFGLERCREMLGTPEFRWEYGTAAAIILGLAAAYLGFAQADMRSDFNPLASVGHRLELTRFCYGYGAVLLAASLAIPALLRWWRVHGMAAAWGVVPLLVVCTGALLWRGGLHSLAVVGWERVTMHPGVRVDVRLTSPAVKQLQTATRREPGLCAGFDLGLIGGFLGVMGLESPICVDALQNPYYKELTLNSPAKIVTGWITPDEAQVSGPLRRFFDLLNVRYYSNNVEPGSPGQPAIRGLRSLGRSDLDLYESTTAWPRAFFTDQAVNCRRMQDIYYALAAEGGRPFAAVLPEEIDAHPDGAALAAMTQEIGHDQGRLIVPARDYRLTSRTTNFRVSAPSGGIVVLSEGYQNDYNSQVYLDGRPVPHLRVNFAFTGVRIPAAGEHEVRVVYGPRDLPWLLAVSGVGGVLAAGTAVWARRRRRGERADAGRRDENGLPAPAAPEGSVREERVVETIPC